MVQNIPPLVPYLIQYFDKTDLPQYVFQDIFALNILMYSRH